VFFSSHQVAEVIPQSLGNLTWTHHHYAVEHDKKNAIKWLEKAEAKNWSAVQLRSAIIRKITGNGTALEPQALRAINRTFRQLLSKAKGVSDPGYVSDVLHTHDSHAINYKQEFLALAKRLHRSADAIQNFMEKH
ncbi:MAG: hypothetical protein KAV82_11785, partial [Phycisphaerae bacterium]|nr:hypothetical protein [Phycisphaerae bacterium]